jgi:catechol 2,3-dioxygenase-like lactoylglutathione lyase family enzyme
MAIMDALDLRLTFYEADKPWAGWRAKDHLRPLFVVGSPFNGKAAAPGNGPMVALLAPDRETVHSAYDRAMENGGSCEGPPGLRPHYHPNYYGAYFRDPDGNKICVCCHDAFPVAETR